LTEKQDADVSLEMIDSIYSYYSDDCINICANDCVLSSIALVPVFEAIVSGNLIPLNPVENTAIALRSLLHASVLLS
jgi:hypothetical protein